MKTRILVGAIIALIYVFVFLLGNTLVQAITVALLAVVGCNEMINALKAKGHKPISWCGYLLAAAIMPVAYFTSGEVMLLLFVMVAALLMVQRVIFDNKISTIDMLWSLVPMAYPLPFFGVMALVVAIDSPIGKLILIYIVVVQSCTDMLAYFIGMAIGKRKLSPNLSPKKSVEGAIAGLFGGVIGAVVVFFVQGLLNTQLPLWIFLLCAPICSVFGQIGDLVASALKREMEIKDYGRLFPGHGGVLDRFDSILFALPIVYIVYMVCVEFGWLVV